MVGTLWAMTFIPAHAVAVWCSLTRNEGELSGVALTAVGDRFALAAKDAPAELVDWWVRCGALWTDARSGHLASHSFVRVMVPLLNAKQSTTKGSRKGLGDELDALAALRGVGDLVAEVTSAAPKVAVCKALATTQGGRFSLGESASTCEFSVTGTLLFPEALGGPVLAGEVRRHFVLEARHAAWRDRPARRLSSVAVSTECVFAGGSAAGTPPSR